jgi:hypothetical protein
VRRTVDEFEWLVHKLQATYKEPVADQMPALSEEDDAMTAVSEFFSLLAQDPELKMDKDFHRFLLADTPILDFGRLDKFTCTVKDFDRNELAGLPTSYLKVRHACGQVSGLLHIP